MNLNKSFIDLSQAQYAPWQAALVAMTPNPELNQNAYRPEAWKDVVNFADNATFFEDPDGNLWFFDAIIKLDHQEAQRITEHPVQKGANITDHSFSLPAHLTLEIGMSDVMDSYAAGQWGTGQSSPTKSVMAYQTLLEWKNSGTPLTITTRLNDYQNMVVEYLSSPDDITTIYGLKCMATFRQIITASIETAKVSARPSVTVTTNKGAKQAKQLDNSSTLVKMEKALK